MKNDMFRNSVLEEAAKVCEAAKQSINKDGIFYSLESAETSANVCENLAKRIRALKQAPQPIAAPDDDGDPIGEMQADAKQAKLDDFVQSAAHSEQAEHETIVREGDTLTCTACGTSRKMADPAASQQPVPALSAYSDLLNVIANRAAGMAAYHDVAPHTCKEIADAIRMTDAAQLVQQRATLSDERINEIWDAHCNQWELIGATLISPIVFARAILSAAGAK